MGANDSLSLTGRTVAGHFLVEGVVADGRRSLVYRAKHIGPDEAVALRVLKVGSSPDPTAVDAFVKRWRAESQALASVVIGDPQLVRSIELGTAATGIGTFAPFAASEWLVGRSLADDIAARGKPRTIKESIDLLAPAATAIAYAHRSGVAHGSLSTHSLYIAESDEGPQMRVLDLGLWMVIAEVAKELPQAASLFVTPWSAPEHLDPSVGDVGLATDVYGLALVVCEMMRGKSVIPITADEAAIRKVVLGADPISPKTLGILFGGHVERCIARALLRDPAQRWPDVGTFWNALKSASQDDDAGVPAPSWNDPEHDTAKRLVLPANLPDDTTGLTPTGPTPTGMTPTGPTNPIVPLGPATDEVKVLANGPPSVSEPKLPDFDDGETTEMPPFARAPSSDRTPIAPPASESRSIVRPLDDEDLTPVQFTSSQRQRAAKKVSSEPPAPAAMPVPLDADATLEGVDIPIDADTDERPVYVPPPEMTPTAPPVMAKAPARRPQKPGDPPPEAAGSGRATGLKVMKPAASAKVSVEHLPSVIVDDAALEAPVHRDSPRSVRPMPPRSLATDEDRTVVQLEPPAARAARAVSPPPAAGLPPSPHERTPLLTRGSLTPQPARHYGASGRRARERRQAVLVAFAVFFAVAVATGLALGLRGAFAP